MRSIIAAIVCLAVAGGTAGRADPPVGSYAPDIEAKDWMNTDGQPISLAECRGMIVVLFCWVSWHSGGEEILPLMTLVNASPYGRKAGVFLIGVTDSDRKRVEDMVTKTKVFFPIALEAKKTFDDYELTSFPRVIILDPAGKIAFAGWPGEKGGQRLVDEIRRVASETPPTRTHPEEAARAEAYLAQARRALRADRSREALEAANKALDHALRGDALYSRCQDMVDLIEALGRDKLARAEAALEQGRAEDAVALLLEVRREFRGAEVAQSSKQKLASLEKKNPEVARLLRTYEDLGQAEIILASAMQAIRDRRFGPAYEKLETLVSEYSSTETAEKAQTILERMQKNPAVMDYVRDHKAARTCRTLLSQAEAYEQTGRVSKARELYREVLDKYADTIFADEAAKRLARLP